MEDLDLNIYLSEYDRFNKIIVYSFKRGQGGIGDLIKFFMYALFVCIKHKFKLYFLIEPPEIYPIHKYIRLKDKYKNMYISDSAITNSNSKYIYIFDEYSIKDKDIQEGIFYKIVPETMYVVTDLFDKIKIKASELFEFSQDIKLNAQIYNNLDYISIHLRLGDKYLETDPHFVNVKNDTRTYNEENLYKFIEDNSHKNIIFFCDNKSYKIKLKEKYNFIIITDYEIGHTSLSNTTEKQIFDSVTEFYILSNSTKIYKASHSGFSIMASKFNNIENHLYSLESLESKDSNES